MNATTDITYSPKDYKSDQYVRWCPGCGDHAVLSCLHKAMAEVGTSPDNMAVISGIGCSSRLPYYMNTYGFHTIHGRGAAIATGVKTARPDISVWLVTRGIDTDAANLTAIFAASARHRGAAVTEVLVNCVIFNNGTHTGITDREVRAERSIFLRHGEKMIFGKNRDKGLVLDGLKLKAVTIGEDGYTMDDILVHDAHERDNTLHLMLAMMSGDLPVALGIIRDVDAPTYDESVHQQIAEVKAKKKAHSLRDMLLSGDTWEVK